MALPTRGQVDWDDELNAHIEALSADVAAASARAVVAASDATYARNRADEVHTAVLGGVDPVTAELVDDDTSDTSASLGTAAADAGHPLGDAVSTVATAAAATAIAGVDFPVDSVNGSTGTVVLDAVDVEAIPAGDITVISVLTQAAYDALDPKVATTLYVIQG